MSDITDLFPGFQSHWIDTEAGRIFARAGGSGPPLVLLHGFPQTHVMWHRVAPELAQRFTVVAMDLRGYGWSSAPDSDDGASYTKREMGKDVVAVMADLGHVRFRVCGHDRGARVGYRLALDHPGHVEKLALLDIQPTCEVWRSIRSGDTPGAHWEFLSKPAPEPETAIRKAPDTFFEGLLAGWTQGESLRAFDARALSQYRAAWGDPSRIHAMCEDYRAGAHQDLEQDEADLAADRHIDCPVLVLSGDFFLTRGLPTPPLETWRRTFAPKASGQMIDSGHFLAEENAAQTLAALSGFL
jgi:haloacetate dehalogenase